MIFICRQTFHHISLEEREKLFAWRESGVSIRAIAKRLGRSHSSLLREYKRHTRYGKEYLPCLADKRAARWGVRQRYHAPLKNPLVFLYVREHLRLGWSPETIAGRIRLDYPGFSIDDETIYRYVYARRQKQLKLWKRLRLHRRRRMVKDGRKVQSRATIPEAIPISRRPQEVLFRTRPGDWESDNMEGLRSDQGAVSVSVDRMTRVTRLGKLPDHTPRSKASVVIGQLLSEPKGWRQTITFDRGLENRYHQLVSARTGVSAYFCNAYPPGRREPSKTPSGESGASCLNTGLWMG